MRATRYALIGGIVGALATYGAWRVMARRTLHVEQVAEDTVQRCLRADDPMFGKAIAKSRQQVLSMMKERRIPGMSITVSVDERVVWSEGFGSADVEAHTPACPDTRFRIGSVSKPITATAMARLYDEGRLDLDAPIRRYVPTFPDKGAHITARQLAAHRAGIRHYRDDNEAFTTKHYDNVLQSLETFQDDPLLFKPGTKHEYSSLGYVLLSAVIQGAAQQEYGSYIEQHVLKPRGLVNTMLERGPPPPRLTRFYDHVTPYVTDGQVHPSPFVDMSSKWASGGMLSTTEDLARFGNALLPNSRTPLLRANTREMLFAPQTHLVPLLFGYALGWMTVRDWELRRLYMHFGAGSGTTAWLGVYPDQRVVVAALANLGHAGFTYASTIGVGSRFAARPILPVVAVLTLAFAGFFAATWMVAWLLRRLRRATAPAKH